MRGKKLTIESVRASFKAEGYTLLDAIYINAKTKLNYICPKGHNHSITQSDWKQGNRCSTCFGKIKPSFKFVKESFEKEGYVLLSKNYINTYSKLDYICPQEHRGNISWASWRVGCRCQQCAKTNKLSFKFIKTSFEKEGYKLLNENYINSRTKLNYICPNGHEHSVVWGSWQRGTRCLTCYRNNNKGQGNPNWKGGVIEKNIPLYNTYASQIDFCEETRRNPKDLNLLQVRCIKCNEWFTPTARGVRSRIKSLSSNEASCHFYCSDECKYSCPIYGKHKYSAEEKRSKTNPNFTSFELKVWSKEVLKRADYICEYCGERAEHAHHIQPKKLEPFYALDTDNGIACCEECHYKYGHKDECSTGVLASIVCTSLF